MSNANIVLTKEAIEQTINENNYIPDNAKNHMTTEEFHSIYGLEVLKSYEKGIELLEFLFGRYQQNEKSLTYSLESNSNITSFFGEAKPGFATTKILNHSKGSWKKFKSDIAEKEAIEIAFNIRNALINVLEKISEDTDAIRIRELLEEQNLYTEQNWLKKYLTILYPNKFMTMLNEDWISRIFVPLGLTPTGDWFKDAKVFSEKAKEFNVDSVDFYHVVFKSATEKVKSELSELGIDTSQLAAVGNLLVNTKNSYEGVKKYIKSEDLQSQFENYLSNRYNWTSKNETTDIVVGISYNQTSFSNRLVQKILDDKNIIFRGAPGTGKSYLAKEIAANIVSGGEKTKYEDLSPEQKKQVEFVQFHPSYDYSDFVEGLRPIKSDKGIDFELKNGIFKEFVESARKNFENSEKTDEVIAKEFQVENAIDNFLEDEQISEKQFETKKGNPFYISDFDNDYIKISIPNNASANEVTLSRKKLQKLLESETEFEKVNQIRKALYRNHASQSTSYFFVLYKEIIKNINKTEKPVKAKEEKKPYVFIIDEINRGEISKIFGELFYSIEPSKRGKVGEISTQYSNMHPEDEPKFYIPENVYIIGTMNDIDRSVDTFDFAMRRRFSFVEITAKESQKMLDSCISDKKIRDDAIGRMDRLNNAISNKEYGLNSNYHIGAAYFMDVKSEADFEPLWNNKLKPLLQEYVVGMYNESEVIEDFEKAYLGKKAEATDEQSDNIGAENEDSQAN